jgi:hypothetical protein
LLTKITANGWLSLWIFLALVVATIVVDAVLISRLPRLPGLSAPPLSAKVGDVAAAWAFRVHKRRLAYAAFRGRLSPQSAHSQVESIVYPLVFWLLERSPWHTASGSPAAASEG